MCLDFVVERLQSFLFYLFFSNFCLRLSKQSIHNNNNRNKRQPCKQASLLENQNGCPLVNNNDDDRPKQHKS